MSYCAYSQQACLPVDERAETMYFLAHSQTVQLLDDLRPAVATALGRQGYQAQPADHLAVGRPLLCNSCLQVRSSRLAIFDLPGPARQPAADARLWLELGLALGHGVPIGLLAPQDQPLPELLAGADVLRYAGYRELERRLPELLAGWLTPRSGCPLCGGRHQRVGRPASSALVLPVLAADSDLGHSVAEALQAAGLSLARLDAPGGAALPICRLADVLGQQQLLLAHVELASPPDVLIAIGLASGLGVPWLIVTPGEELPACLEGLQVVHYASYRGLEQALGAAVPAFLERCRRAPRDRRQQRREERALQEEMLRQAVRFVLEHYVGEEAPDEHAVFEQVVWQVLGQGKWPDERRPGWDAEALRFFDGAVKGVGLARSPTATTLLLAAVRPALERGWVSPHEVVARLGKLAASWGRDADEVVEGLADYVAAHLSTGVEKT